ncbi:hypothetical protein [Chimaeribacter arupi]|uniref:hypothetical protein n=1 Tax=Chimaeribacter arupi TaxID=2060066 RepID=UPI0013FD0525|nr:hypothetical protein [Chimaeribacter arupi]
MKTTLPACLGVAAERRPVRNMKLLFISLRLVEKIIQHGQACGKPFKRKPSGSER